VDEDTNANIPQTTEKNFRAPSKSPDLHGNQKRGEQVNFSKS
jgi:hypothetical protein